MKKILLDETLSTNIEIKRYLAGGEDVALSARRQTGGMGTKGRSFLSGEGGVYLSVLNFYENFPAGEAFRVMIRAAVAACRTAEHYGVRPEIKWPNDVLAGGKKLCGILIENGVREGLLAYSVVGIGLNVNNDVSALGIAVSLRDLVGPCPVGEVRENLLENFMRGSEFSDYLGYVKFLGREVRVTENGRTFRALARRILPDGRLEIGEGTVRALSSAEISLSLE